MIFFSFDAATLCPGARKAMEGAGGGDAGGPPAPPNPEPGEGPAGPDVAFHEDEEIIEVLELNDAEPNPGTFLY